MASYRPGFATTLTTNPEARTLVLAVLLVAVAIPGIAQIRSAHAVSSLQPHVPIVIDGDSNFLQSNGVTSGHGTSQDPYIIEGWSIASDPSHGPIYIANTNAFFIIRNVETLQGYTGIYLLHVSNGSVLNSTSIGTIPIRIEGSQNITVARNKFTGGQLLDYDGSNLITHSFLVIANNTIVDGSIYISSCGTRCLQSRSIMRVSGNTIISHYNTSGGIFIDAVGATIADNIEYGVGKGIVGGSIVVSGSGNTVGNNTVNGIGISANATRLSGNIMTGGISLNGGSPSYYDSQTIDASNLVNGNPVVYYNRCAGLNVANVIVGQLIIASCSGVKVTNLTVSNAGVGIFMAYVKQASLVDNHARSNGFGLWAIQSSNVTVSNSDFTANGNAILIDSSANFTLTGNSISGNYGGGLGLESSNDVRVAGNIIASNGGGFSAVGGVNLVLSGNRIKDNGLGVELHSLTKALVQGNWISGNQEYGLWVLSGNGFNITANTLLYNGRGISFGIDFNGGYVYNAVVYHNNLVYNLVDQADHSEGIVPTWDNGYPSGGDYWSDYTGVDNCSGQQQNICTGPDGIGDTPYTGILQINSGTPVQSSLVDHYPLMRPYGNVTQDVTVPSWRLGSILVLTGVNSTSVSLHWSPAADDTWVSKYEISQDGRLVATVPGNLLSYTLSGLSPGATYLFKVDAADPGGNLSTDGPSSSITMIENTSTTLVCSPSTVQVGGSITCTATATDPGFSGYGNVGFTSDGAGSFTVSQCTLLVGAGVSSTCSTEYTPTALGSGTHTITATYTGVASHHTSSGTFPVTVTAPPHVPGPARTPSPTFFSTGWWTQNPIWMITAGATAAAVAGATVLARRRLAASRDR